MYWPNIKAKDKSNPARPSN